MIYFFGMIFSLVVTGSLQIIGYELTTIQSITIGIIGALLAFCCDNRR